MMLMMPYASQSAMLLRLRQPLMPCCHALRHAGAMMLPPLTLSYASAHDAAPRVFLIIDMLATIAATAADDFLR